MGYGRGMKKTREQAGQRKAKGDGDAAQEEQKALLKACMRTLHHFFGGWDTLFGRVADGRNREWITYPLPVLLSTGVLMYLFRLGARRQRRLADRAAGPAAASHDQHRQHRLRR